MFFNGKFFYVLFSQILKYKILCNIMYSGFWLAWLMPFGIGKVNIPNVTLFML